VKQKNIKLKLAQWRMLGRIVRGERLHVSRFRLENRTVDALSRKNCILLEHGRWYATALGRDVHAHGGFWFPRREAA
jgi:hypothetical protein